MRGLLTGDDPPEGAGLAQLPEHPEQFLTQLEAMQKEIRLQPSSIVRAAEHACPFIEWQRAFGCRRIIGRPAANVCFRPEEIHVVSGVRPVVIPAWRRQVGLTNHSFREGEDRVISHPQAERFGTVEAAGVDLDVPTGE